MMANIMDDVQQILARVPAWQQAQEISVERLAGLTNTNFRITVDGERFVLRVSGKNTERMGINRAHELAALQAAAAAGIGPQVMAFLPPEGHLVTRWVDGRHWEASEFRTPENVRRLTRTVQAIHALPPNGAVFSPFQRVNNFLDIACSFGVPIPSNLEDCQETMAQVQADQDRDSGEWERFCHNDLVCVNYLVVDADDSIQVLDWEFSGWGDVYYDLATVVYTHDSEGPIPHSLEEEMLDCYFGAVTDWQRRRLAGMKFMLMLFTGAWALAQHGMMQGGLILPVEGFDYLEFAQFLFLKDISDVRAQFLDLSGNSRVYETR